jgi:hypothetical protein
MKKVNRYIGIDQHGQTFRNLRHPRKDLCNLLGRKHIQKMYVDAPNGEARHIGYVVSGLWITVYALTQLDEVQRSSPPQAEVES